MNALVAAVSCLCDAGDYVLCEEFAYSHAPECVFVPRGLHMLPVSAPCTLHAAHPSPSFMHPACVFGCDAGC